MYQSYDKPALSPEALLDKLCGKGLVISNPDYAFHCLKTVSYHRLTHYFDPFTISQSEGWRFRPHSQFEEVWRLYEFDRELRSLTSDALERIEVAFRTAISDNMSIKYGPHWYLEAVHFKNKVLFQQLKKQVSEICGREKQSAIEKYYKKYNHPELPPCWIIMEYLSFGTCTNTFHNLKLLADKKAICEIFGYHPTAIASWIDALRYTRNLCAHHARLWNRWFIFSPKLSYLYGKDFGKERTFFAQAIIIQKLLQAIAPNYNWKQKLISLFENNPNVPIEKMGFQKEWKADNFWQC